MAFPAPPPVPPPAGPATPPGTPAPPTASVVAPGASTWPAPSPASPDGAAPTAGAAPLLRAGGLSMVYRGGVAALNQLTVEVPRGSVGLVGANGAGKTTLFRLMLGLMQPSAGWLEVAGRSVAHDPIGVRSRLGYMPEHDCLPLDQTASDVVSSFGEIAGLPPRAARQRASDMLDLVGLDEARFRPVGSFSTGMRQRTKLAQALVADPELVLLDEPTAGLDPVGREQMLELLARLAGFGISAIMATHLLDDVERVCDHVVMIDRGQMVLSGPIEQLVERTGVMRVEVGGRVGSARVLAETLAGRGVAAVMVAEQTVDVDTSRQGEEAFDIVRDTVAELGLRLYSLSTRHRSLDDLFLQRAARNDALQPNGPAPGPPSRPGMPGRPEVHR